MKNPLDLFAAEVRSVRVKRNLTQRQLADKLHMSVRTIIELEGCKSSPRFETVAIIARELDISLDTVVLASTRWFFRISRRMASPKAWLISFLAKARRKFKSTFPSANRQTNLKHNRRLTDDKSGAACCGHTSSSKSFRECRPGIYT